MFESHRQVHSQEELFLLALSGLVSLPHVTQLAKILQSNDALKKTDDFKTSQFSLAVLLEGLQKQQPL